MTPITLPLPVSPEAFEYALERYDVAQAAIYLGVSVCSIRRLVGAKAIGHLRDGQQRIRFAQADLDAWRRAHRVEVGGKPARRQTAPSVRVASVIPKHHVFQ